MPKGYPRIPRMSNRRRKIFRAYSELRKEFLQEHPMCECCHLLGRERAKRAIHVHHKKGRGKYELVQSTWAALCEKCHRHIHDHPAWSYERGLLVNRATPLSDSGPEITSDENQLNSSSGQPT